MFDTLQIMHLPCTAESSISRSHFVTDLQPLNMIRFSTAAHSRACKLRKFLETFSAMKPRSRKISIITRAPHSEISPEKFHRLKLSEELKSWNRNLRTLARSWKFWKFVVKVLRPEILMTTGNNPDCFTGDTICRHMVIKWRIRSTSKGF